MKLTILLISLLFSVQLLQAQTQEPTLDETVQWVKTQVLAFGRNVKTVTWEMEGHKLIIGYLEPLSTVPTASGNLYYFSLAAVTNFFSNLSTANIIWKEYDDGVGLEVYAVKNIGSTIITIEKAVGSEASGGNVSALTELNTENRPVCKISFQKSFNKEMQGRFTKAIKRLIYLSGGKVEVEKF